MPLLGAHMSIEGGLHKAFERISLIGGQSLQIFSKNQRQWRVPELSPSEIETFIKMWEQWGKGPVETSCNQPAHGRGKGHRCGIQTGRKR